MKKQILATMLALASAALGTLCSCSGSETIEVRIIHTTDVHGNLLPYDYINQKEDTGGMARFSTLMQSIRRESPNVLLLDGGDILQGEPITYYSNYIDTTRINAVTEAMNYLGYDAVTIGNHDIEPGHKTYDRFVREAAFPVLGANVVRLDNGAPYFEPYKTFDRGGARITVLGLTTPAIPQWLPQSLWSGMRFDDIIASAKEWVPRLLKEEKPDVLIALIHSGMTNDNADYLENAGERLAAEVPGIDLILIGHDHRQASKWIKRSDTDSVLVMNPANHLDWASDVRIKLEKRNGRLVGKTITGDMLDVNKYAIDTAYMMRMKPWADGVHAFLDKRVCLLQAPVDAPQALFGASSYLNVVHQMQIATVEADISFAAPLKVNAHFDSGDVYVRDLFKWCPFSNYLYAMELTGEEIDGYLEHSYAGWVGTMHTREDRLIALRPDAKASDRFKTIVPPYNYSSAYGIDYTVDVTKPAGNRVQILQMTNGDPFDPTKRYRVAINSYRAGGAGGMLTIGSGIPKADLPSRIVATSEYDQFFSLLHYLQRKAVIQPEAPANWRFLPEAWVRDATRRDSLFLFGK